MKSIAFVTWITDACVIDALRIRITVLAYINCKYKIIRECKYKKRRKCTVPNETLAQCQFAIILRQFRNSIEVELFMLYNS